MSRPMYETPEDLANEKQICDRLSEVFGCTFKKLPIRYHADFLIVRDGVCKGWLEIKNRNIPSDRYDSFLLDLAKVMRMHELADETGLPAVLAVRWSDGRIGFHTLSGPLGIVYTGRTDRNDSQDMGPCSLIPMDRFIFLDEIEDGTVKI